MPWVTNAWLSLALAGSGPLLAPAASSGLPPDRAIRATGCGAVAPRPDYLDTLDTSPAGRGSSGRAQGTPHLAHPAGQRSGMEPPPWPGTTDSGAGEPWPGNPDSGRSTAPLAAV